MPFALYDFAESINGVELPSKPKRVIKAWGNKGNYAEWEGGFVIELEDGQFAYIEGWCDTTGWGCKDGSDLHLFSKIPEEKDLPHKEGQRTWEEYPKDLNDWIKNGMKNPYD